MSNDPGENGPSYYRPGPSSGHYPQYPQNPYPQGWTPGTPPVGHPQPARPPAAAPYGSPQAPAGLGPTPRVLARPRQVRTALVLLVASAIPFVVMGVTTMFMTLDDAMLNRTGIPRSELDAAISQAGLSMAQFNELLRVMGGIFVALAAVYVAISVVAFLGRAGARLTVAILTAVYGLPLLLMMISTMPIFPVLVLGVAAGGVALLYSAPAKEWYAARKLRPAR